MRYERSDYERTAIEPMLPNKPRGVPRVDGSARAQWLSFGSCVQVRHGATCLRPIVPAPPVTTASVVGGGWDQIMDELAAGHDAAVQMIDTSVVRILLLHRSLCRFDRPCLTISCDLLTSNSACKRLTG
jgi:hypothetical protein